MFGNKLAESITTGSTATTQGFAYDANNTLYADVNSSGVIQTRYVSGVTGPDTWLARVTSTGGAWLLDDYQGSVRVVDGFTGGVLDVIGYDAFGAIVSQTNSSEMGEIGFQGGWYDKATGTWGFGQRQENPQTGRWTVPDSLGLSAGSNQYVFNGNAPTNHTDPSGLDSIDTYSSVGTRVFVNWKFDDGQTVQIGELLKDRKTVQLVEGADDPVPLSTRYLQLNELQTFATRTTIPNPVTAKGPFSGSTLATVNTRQLVAVRTQLKELVKELQDLRAEAFKLAYKQYAAEAQVYNNAKVVPIYKSAFVGGDNPNGKPSTAKETPNAPRDKEILRYERQAGGRVVHPPTPIEELFKKEYKDLHTKKYRTFPEYLQDAVLGPTEYFLDLASFLPVIGTPAQVGAGILAAKRGDYTKASLDFAFAAATPGIGAIVEAGVAKLAEKLADRAAIKALERIATAEKFAQTTRAAQANVAVALKEGYVTEKELVAQLVERYGITAEEAGKFVKGLKDLVNDAKFAKELTEAAERLSGVASGGGAQSIGKALTKEVADAQLASFVAKYAGEGLLGSPAVKITIEIAEKGGSSGVVPVKGGFRIDLRAGATARELEEEAFHILYELRKHAS